VAENEHSISGASKADIGILTIRDDEFRAVLGVFPDKAGVFKGTNREYTLRHADAGNGERYTIAVLRLVEQGHGEAQDAARDLIDDLAPRLVLVVGIAGGLPSDEVTLGDVVVSTRVHDFTVEARKTGQKTTFAVTGGPVDKALAAVVANLAAREDELGNWTAGLPSPPPVIWTRKGQLYGPPEWQSELRDKLVHHYGKGSSSREPKYVAGPIASSDRLVKDPDLLIPWLQTARNLLAIEMESGGVYRAVRERCPMLAIRGISDIVGLKRAAAWTKFACASAAAFTRAFLRTRPISQQLPNRSANPLSQEEAQERIKRRTEGWDVKVGMVIAAVKSVMGTMSYYALETNGKGAVYCHADGPRRGEVFRVREGIGWYYQSVLLGAASRLGLPIKDEESTGKGAVHEFETGYIEWDRRTSLARACLGAYPNGDVFDKKVL
jgi:nucleoside phosphorylase